MRAAKLSVNVSAMKAVELGLKTVTDKQLSV